MKIEFGCGDSPTKENFLTCDIRNLPGITFVCECWDIDKHVSENSVEEIFSRHFFEHLTFKQGSHLLDVWYKILKPGGKIGMIIPNMDYHAKQWLNGNDYNRAKKSIFGHQRGSMFDTWDIHKSGYNKDTLKELIEGKNFKKYTILDDGKHLSVEFFKSDLL